MSDITFSMTADEKDVTKALQNLIKENAKLRSEIQKGVDEQKAAAKQEQEWAKLREKNAKEAAQQMQQLNAAAARIRESVATPFELASKKVAELREHLQAGRLSTEEYRRAYANVAKELKEATRDHEAEARAAKAAAEVKAEAARKAAEAEREHAAAMREADAITQKLMTKEERYTANVAKLNALKDKGVLSSQSYARAIAAEEKALNNAGESTGTLTGKMAQFVAGLASGAAIVATIRAEYDLLIARQGAAKDANINLATQQEALLMNLGGADAGGVFKSIREMSAKSGVKEENVTAAVNDAMAARADLAVSDVVNAVGSVSKIRKLAPTEMAGLAAATIDTQKQTGLGTDQSLGFLLQLQGQARTKNLKFLAENFTPAVGGVMNFGTDRQTAGAMLSALSHGMGDVTGAMSATSAIQLSKQLREFAPGQDIGKSIEALQRDPVMRQKFLSGASFEAKALPAIESLLSGGTQAKQFAAARQALSADPMTALSDAITSRGASQSITVAEQALAVANVQNQADIANTSGASSAINREAIAQMRMRAGRAGLSTQFLGIADDLRSGGVQTPEMQQQAIQAEIARLEAGRSDKSALVNAGASALFGGPLAGMVAERTVTSRDKDSEFNREQIAVLKEMLSELQRQTGNAQAGVVAGRRNNQGENAP